MKKSTIVAVIGTIIILSLLIISIGLYVNEYYTPPHNTYTDDYFDDIFMNPFPYWEKEYIEVQVTGNKTPQDCEYTLEILDEWNYMVESPKLGIGGNISTDILIEFVDNPHDASWAGGTWISPASGDPITYSKIVIRTSYPYCRENVIRHELGHAIGLSYHSTHLNSSIYKTANIHSTYWSQRDMQEIGKLYPLTPAGQYYADTGEMI